jgi:primase-polymerase (primpol)-like protein
MVDAAHYPPRPPALAVKPENIPGELKALHQWVDWRYEYQPKRDPKKPWTKPPINPRQTSRHASSTNPKSWGTFEVALERYQRYLGRFKNGLPLQDLDGIGLVLRKENHIVGVDLDKCRDANTREIQAWAWEIVRELDTYTEISPSGSGLRCFGQGTLSGTGVHKDPIEIYDQGRYLTTTGHHVEGTPATIEPRQEAITALYDRLRTTAKATPRAEAPQPNGDAPRLEDDQLLRNSSRARKSSRKLPRAAGGSSKTPSSAGTTCICPSRSLRQRTYRAEKN